MNTEDYIRYKEDNIQKIGRIEKISATLADDVLIMIVDNGDVITSDDVLKSDKSILHEIEVGDYVNGCPVLHKENNELVCGLLLRYKEENVENIVTKQQFEATQYVVKED